MMLRSLVVVMTLAATAYAKPPTNADAIALAGRLATALEHDAPLGDLADPQDGVHLWQRPGVDFIDEAQLHATDKPSKRIAASYMNDYYKDNYAKVVAKGVRYALAHLDVDPSKPDDARYQVDCGRDALPRRASLASFVLQRKGDVKVTFVVRDGKLYVANVYLDDACSV